MLTSLSRGNPADSKHFYGLLGGLLVAKKELKQVSELVNYYERRLIREIEALEGRIAELRQEQEALRRQLLKARWETHALRDVSRLNSGTRVMVEERILGALHEASKPLTNKALFSVAQVANYQLKPNTFRTYLMRLKEKGLIESPQRGTWQLAKTIEA